MFLNIEFKAIWMLKSFFWFQAILGNEGGTQKFKATAQNKAIQISNQMI